MAKIRVHPTGSVTVFTGTHSHGQGHETTFAQLVVDQLGVPLDQVEVVHGDTAKIPFGMGTYGSRSLAVGGSAMVKAMDKVIAKGKKIAAHLMEASVEDIEFANNKFTVAGTDKSKTLTDISLAAYVPHNYPIEELEPGLDETAFYDPKNFTFPGGCHIAEVEIDPETGMVEMVNFTAVDDVGRVINPMIVEGQVQGGVAQGIGQALLEAAPTTPVGNCCPGSFMDYTMPRADDLPNSCPSRPRTPCARTIRSARRAVARLARSARRRRSSTPSSMRLKDYGVRHLDMPATGAKSGRSSRPRSRIWRRNKPRQKGISRCTISLIEKPTSLADAVKASVRRHGRQGSGGRQTFIPVLKQRLNKPTVVVDLSKLGLSGITVSGDKVTIGAMTTHAAIASHPDIKAKIPGLAHQAALIGDDGGAPSRHDGRITGEQRSGGLLSVSFAGAGRHDQDRPPVHRG